MSDQGLPLQLSPAAEAALAEALSAREQAVINAALIKLSGGQLDPQTALNFWVSINEVRHLKRAFGRKLQQDGTRHPAQL